MHRVLFKISGRDATDFLQRITAQNVFGIEDRSITSFILSATGKIEALFALTKAGDNHFFVEVPASKIWQNAFLDRIDHYKFSEDLKIEQVDQKHGWVFQKPKTGRGFLSAWVPSSNLYSVYGGDESLSQEDYLEWRINNLCPEADSEILLNVTNPLEANLVSAIERNKGCYPGQEVVEKTFTYSEPPYRLAKLACRNLERGLDIQAKDGQIVGKVTSATTKGQGLGYIRKTHARVENDAVSVEGNTCSIVSISTYP